MVGIRAWIVLVASALTVALGVPARVQAQTSPIGAHSMLQLNDPEPFMQTMFAEAAAMGASSIRLDVAPALVFPSASQPPDFSGLDDVMTLSTEYHLNVVADLFTIPYWIAACPTPEPPADAERCGTDDLAQYGAMIGEIVAHADPVIHDWEVWNEPDTAMSFDGTPAQYAWMLRTAHDTIKNIDPADEVLLGGISDVAGTSWLADVLAVPGADAIGAFDIANLHERNGLDALTGDITSMREFLAGYGFTGPLWITEHGYPSDPAFQYDPDFAAGPASQAAFLTASIPTMLDAGASMVFVTERDNLSGEFASEGLLGGDVTDPPSAAAQPIRTPAFGAVQTLAACYASLGRDCPASPAVVSPAAVALGTVRFRTSARATVTISDPDEEPLGLGRATAVPGSDDPVAIAQDSCAALLEPDQTCTVTVDLTAVEGGPQRGVLSLASDQGAVAVPITATVPSVSSLETGTRMRFVPVGRAAGAVGPRRLVLALRNPLDAPIRIAGARLSGDGFAIRADRCARQTVRAGGTCRLSVWWQPGGASVWARARARLTVTGAGAPLILTLPMPVGRA